MNKEWVKVGLSSQEENFPLKENTYVLAVNDCFWVPLQVMWSFQQGRMVW